MTSDRVPQAVAVRHGQSTISSPLQLQAHSVFTISRHYRRMRLNEMVWEPDSVESVNLVPVPGPTHEAGRGSPALTQVRIVITTSLVTECAGIWAPGVV